MTKIEVQDRRVMRLAEKVGRGERVDGQDGVAIYGSTDLLGIGDLANYVREQRHGSRAWCRLDLNSPPVLAVDNHARIVVLLAIEEVAIYEVPLRPRLTGHTYLKAVAVARLLLPQALDFKAGMSTAVANLC